MTTNPENFATSNDYFDYVSNALKRNSFEEILEIWNTAVNYGNQGLFVRLVIEKEIYNIADRFNLIENRLTLKDLETLYNERRFYEQLAFGDTRSLLNELKDNPTEQSIKTLIKAVKVKKVPLQTLSDLGKVIYIIVQATGTKEINLIQLMFLGPNLFLRNSEGDPSNQRSILSGIIVEFLQDFGDVKVAQSLKKILQPIGEWSVIVNAIGFDPVTRYEERQRELTRPLQMEIENGRRIATREEESEEERTRLREEESEEERSRESESEEDRRMSQESMRSRSRSPRSDEDFESTESGE